MKLYFFKRAAQAIVLLFAFIGFVSIFSSDPPTENEAPDTKVAQPIVQPQAEPVPVAATPPVKEQAPQPDMETETETSGIIIAPAVNVEELSCPEPVSVKLEYNKAVPVRRIASDAVEQWGLKAGALDALPKAKTRTFYWAASASSALSVLERGGDWIWYRDGDTIRFVKRDDPVLATSARLVATRFELEVVPTDGGLTVTVDSDLADRQEITVSIHRVYFESGRAEAYSNDYFRQCGFAAQWRVPKFIPIDDEAWKVGLIAHQDKMAVLGKDAAFDISEISDRVEIDAHSRFNDAESSILLPLTVSIRPKSSLVGADDLVLGESYELLAGTQLIPRISSTSEGGRRLDAGEIIRVDGIEHGGLARWYLVTVGGRPGWVSSIGLLPEGVRRVSTGTDREQKAAGLRQTLMDNVFGPCIEYAYNKLVKGRDVNEQDARLAMYESIQPHLNDLVSELMEMVLALLPESEIRRFYLDSLDNCKAGVGLP